MGAHAELVESQYQNVTVATPEPGSETPVAEKPKLPEAITPSAGVPAEIVGGTVSTNVTSAVCVSVVVSVVSVAVYVTVSTFASVTANVTWPAASRRPD